MIPKGWPMRGLKPQDAAAIEASEEAGLVGQIEDHPIGSYHYVKQLKGGPTADVQVIVFPFRVAATRPTTGRSRASASSSGSATAGRPRWSPSPPCAA